MREGARDKRRGNLEQVGANEAEAAEYEQLGRVGFIVVHLLLLKL